jgi:acyl-coenzyme A thioesterase 13
MSIRDGFAPLFRTSPVLDLIGPIFFRGEGIGLVLGMEVEAKHCNGRGVIHGGILATLADVALGYTVAFSTTPAQALVTTHLSVDYAGTARIGDWLETSVEVQKMGARLAFANGYINNGSERIVHASAVYLVTGGLS